MRFIFLYKIGHGEYLQTILVQPKSVEAPVGATVVLECVVFNQYGEVAWWEKKNKAHTFIVFISWNNRCKDGHCTMGRERPLYFIPRYEILGDKQTGMREKK